MPRLRAFLLWIFVVALPLQGYAAAAMVYCALPQAGVTAAELESHSGPHDHAAHGHAAHGHGEMAMASDHDHDGAAESASAGPDGFHKCGTCAACHATALPNTLQWPAFADLPRADPAALLDAVPTPSLRLLDKPPRA